MLDSVVKLFKGDMYVFLAKLNFNKTLHYEMSLLFVHCTL